jgi:hypothetical protein
MAQEDRDYLDLSTLIRDSVLNVSNFTLQDALAMEPGHIDTIDYAGYSPLHWAAQLGYSEKVELLVLSGAAVDLPTRPMGYTALHMASWTNNLRLVSFLVKNGANIEARTSDGCTPLHYCLTAECARILLAAGAKVDALCRHGTSALHHLVFVYSRTESRCGPTLSAISELVAAGADCNHKNIFGLSPFLLAAETGQVATLEHLYSLGAATNATNIEMESVLDFTCAYYGFQQTEALRKMGICGIDPDRSLPPGLSTIKRFEYRMLGWRWQPGQRSPTQADVFSFYALVSEIRQRNWESGLFLYSKTRLETNGGIERLGRWLGWQWQKMHDDDSFAQQIWDPGCDKIPRVFDGYDDDMNDYDMSIIFGKENDDGLTTHSPEQVSERTSLGEVDEEMDEFFDARS